MLSQLLSGPNPSLDSCEASGRPDNRYYHLLPRLIGRAERLRAELSDLQRVQRPRFMASIGQIGDSDRDALSVQRRRLREMDRRIEYLSRMCSNLEVIDPAQQRSDKVVFGATVSAREQGGAERVYRIVGVDEADPEKGSISYVSPVARSRASASSDPGRS